MKLQFLSLLQLAYAHSGTAISTYKGDGACSFDPFYYLRPTPPPVCSLTLERSRGTEPSTELLSFEEWKQVQLATTQQRAPSLDARNASRQQHHKGLDAGEDAEAPKDPSLTAQGGMQVPSSSQNNDTRNEFRVPLTDRFNYAAQDCTARIHSSHKGAKSPSSVLSSKKDRYMLSQCSAKSKYVIVELCDDVRIDTVQLANYEFFSGVFKDVKISLSENAPGDPQSWIDAGTYRAKNIRGVQSFHPSEGRRTFYRYIRIDFLSHYGNEYYCPVSLLRVYGLTHMEDYKWAGWQTGDEIPGHVEMMQESVTVTDEAEGQEALSAKAIELGVIANSLAQDATQNATSLRVQTPLPLAPSEAVNVPARSPDNASAGDLDGDQKRISDATPSPATIPHMKPTPYTPDEPSEPPAVVTGTSPDSVAVEAVTTAMVSELLSPLQVSAPSINVTPPPTPPSTTMASTSVRSVTTSASPQASVAPVPAPGASTSPGGENIFRTIMNRLHILETNSTLGMRYMEEQTRSVRHVVQKLEEDVGRLQGLGKSQQRLLERAVLELEQQKKDMDAELMRLGRDIQRLSREASRFVTAEKRQGFLQLCFLIFLFIFMALTRGSRESTTAARVRKSISSWPSGDWARWRKITTTEMAPENGHAQRPGEPDVPQISTALENATRRRASIDIFAPSPTTTAGPSGLPTTSRPLPPFRTPLSPFRPSHRGLATRQGVRPRVTSTPSLPTRAGHRSGFPKKNTSHLHEVTTVPYREAVAANNVKGDKHLAMAHAIDLTPRIQRPAVVGNGSRPTSLSSIRRRSLPRKGKGGDGAGSIEAEAEIEDYDDGGRSEYREVSPSSTAAGNDSSTDDPDSGAWEDTSTEADDDADMEEPYISNSPRADNNGGDDDDDDDMNPRRVRPGLVEGRTTSFVRSHTLKPKNKPGHQASLSQETVRIRS
ncbi:hypothetical protein FRB96_008474 [Tulasnella sp. 330]|nr:hypothetical protein FRB96_008474 [Tulasnella sp. 330]KAG8889321.1 hypothetical protein FRB98_004938 [Tulasnella sp. 332]